MEYTISDFFSKRFENESTEIFLSNSQFFSKGAMIDYVTQITKVSLNDFILYITNNPITNEITSRDITQLSSINDCTFNMCEIMTQYGIDGLTLPEIATLLHADNKYKDNLVALNKYGENHVKTAMQLGLTIIKNDFWYPTAIGSVFCNLSECIRNKYLCLTLFRDPFYSRVITSLLNADVDLRDFMTILSESTQKRRTSSCNRVMSFFFNQCDIENISVHNIISK